MEDSRRPLHVTEVSLLILLLCMCYDIAFLAVFFGLLKAASDGNVSRSGINWKT